MVWTGTSSSWPIPSGRSIDQHHSRTLTLILWLAGLQIQKLHGIITHHTEKFDTATNITTGYQGQSWVMPGHTTYHLMFPKICRSGMYRLYLIQCSNSSCQCATFRDENDTYSCDTCKAMCKVELQTITQTHSHAQTRMNKHTNIAMINCKVKDWGRLLWYNTALSKLQTPTIVGTILDKKWHHSRLIATETHWQPQPLFKDSYPETYLSCGCLSVLSHSPKQCFISEASSRISWNAIMYSVADTVSFTCRVPNGIANKRIWFICRHWNRSGNWNGRPLRSVAPD